MHFSAYFPGIHRREEMNMSSRAEEKANMNKAVGSDKPGFLSVHPNIVPIVSLVFTALIAFHSWSFSSGALSNKVDQISDDIAEIKNEENKDNESVLNTINEMSRTADKTEERLNGIDKQIEQQSNLINRILEMIPTIAARSAITEAYSGVDAPCKNSATKLSAKIKIAYSKNISGMDFTVEQLADQPLLLPYTENGKEVYFYGQVDEAGSWDGHCIVNFYEDNKLTLITDAQYDGGKLLSCKQAFPDSLPNGDQIWSISNRTIKDGFSEGETWRYFSSGDCTKDFAIDSVTASDILDVDTLKLENAGAVEGYYSGCNSNGSYNDDTGNAYYVQYFRDGTVKTLYVGRFEKGNFQDTTGTAWMIGNDGEGTPYCYYKGPFNQGNPINDPKYWEQPLTVERVKEIVAASGMKFNCELKWEKDKV